MIDNQNEVVAAVEPEQARVLDFDAFGQKPGLYFNLVLMSDGSWSRLGGNYETRKEAIESASELDSSVGKGSRVIVVQTVARVVTELHK